MNPLLDTVAGAVPYWLLSSPKWHTKKCVAPPLHQLFLVNFPPVHHNQIPQGQAPTDQAPCWDFILLRSESLPTLSVPVHLSVCLSVSLWPECLLTMAPSFLVCQHHAPTYFPRVPTPPHSLISLSLLCFRGTCLDAGPLRGKREKEGNLSPAG